MFSHLKILKVMDGLMMVLREDFVWQVEIQAM